MARNRKQTEQRFKKMTLAQQKTILGLLLIELAKANPEKGRAFFASLDAKMQAYLDAPVATEGATAAVVADDDDVLDDGLDMEVWGGVFGGAS